jgi:4-amino-4-deoxy-L-arabinose transferase-like glycosyltransferase
MEPAPHEERPFTSRSAETRRDLLLVAVLVVAVTAFDIWWRLLETRPPHEDTARHLSDSVTYLHWFSVGHPLRFIDGYLLYPPFTYWITDAFYAAFGTEAMWVAVLSNVVWLSMLAFATYGIGRRLWNARVGWLSVVFVVCSPIVVSAFKEYTLDTPLMAIAALSLYLLIRAEGFASRRYSLLYGIACGCGLLVKWTFPLVLALPTVHAFAGALAAARLRRRFDPLLNAAVAAALTFAIAGTWYVHNLSRLVDYVRYAVPVQASVERDPPVMSFASAFWYLWNLVNRQLYVLPFLFVLAGVVFAIRKRSFAARNAYPILLIVGTLVFFTLLRNKDPRYTEPMLPAVAVLATSRLEYLRPRTRAFATAALLAYGALAFLGVSFGTSVLPKEVRLRLPTTRIGPSSLTVFAQHGYLIGPPTDERWHQADVFTAMTRYPRSQRTFAFEGAETTWFNHWGLSYYALRYGARPTSVSDATFVIERGRAGDRLLGYTRLKGWQLPGGDALGLYGRTSRIAT